jgi:hypothetical protein
MSSSTRTPDRFERLAEMRALFGFSPGRSLLKSGQYFGAVMLHASAV